MKILFIFLILSPHFRSNASPGNNLNIAIFFTHADDEYNIVEQEALNFLNLHEETRIRLDEDDDSPGSPNCKEHLKNSLVDLASFCHTVMKMKIAITAVSNEEMTYDIQEPEKFKRLSRSTSTKEQTPPETKNIITSSEHTEVFDVRVKRNAKTKNDKKQDPKKNKTYSVEIINEVPFEKSTKKPWATFDIMAFFGLLFEQDSKEKSDETQNGPLDIDKNLNEQIDTGYFFERVNSTLNSLLDAENGFLMITLGGHLNTINDKYGSLAQSIKHITETANCENNTLIIVTGCCRSYFNDFESVATTPIYARGPYSDRLSECKLLYDIPLSVENSLQIHREKASIFSTDP